MLTHTFSPGAPIGRVVVLGPSGSVGLPIVQRLRRGGIEPVTIGHGECDLTHANAGATLAGLLKAGDVIVFVSARAPTKTRQQFIENMLMADAVCQAIGLSAPSHVVYISSDAVYADCPGALDEKSLTLPASLHGLMHLSREMLLKDAWEGPLCIVRPTLVYGPSDRHNGYGPNRFWRESSAGGPIKLFGRGEEVRDHILADDIAEIVFRTIERRSSGVINAATGVALSFHEIAELILKKQSGKAGITYLPRSGPMPHDGRRIFDVSAVRAAFPDFQFTSFEAGLGLLAGGMRS